MTDTDITPPEQAVSLLRLPGFVSCLAGRSLSAFSSQVQAVAVGWQIYALTHSTMALGLVGLAQFLPMTVLVFIAGHAADHLNRRAIVVTAQIFEAIGALILATGSFGHWLTPTLIYLLVMLFGVARAFEMPAQQTFLPSIVAPSEFPRAAALSSSLFQSAVIMGPSVGGLLFGIDATFCYALCAAGFFIAACTTSFLRLRFPSRTRQPITLAAVFGGIAFLRRQPAILGAMSLDLFAVLLGGATAMLPVFATDILRAGPLGLGFLRAAPGLGALFVSAILARSPLQRHAGRSMFICVFIFGAATILFGMSRSLVISILLLVLLGAADVISMMVRGALVQLGTPDEMRGRVSAVNMLFIGSSNQLGEFESGVLATAIGPVEAVIVGGIGTIVIAALWMKLFPALKNLDRLDQITPPAP